MNIIVVGVNHKTTPVEIREKLAFTGKNIEMPFQRLQRIPELTEKVILSTCNRVEIYARVSNIEVGVSKLKGFFYEYHGIQQGLLDKCFYLYSANDAIRHLFMVSSSLDSMVVGEPQILGQVKEAYQSARTIKATGLILNQLFEKAFSVAKKIRTGTGIAENPVSISFAAVELAKKIFGYLEGKTVMLIGAGEMSELAAKHLVSNGVKTVWVSNRTFDRAVELARELNGNAIRFENINDELHLADIVISSTGAPHFIIRKNIVEKIIHIRKNKPIFFIDIAVPRDIEPSVNEVENVYLYDIDDLQNVIDANMKMREKEAQKAKVIIQKEVMQFISWMDTLDVVPTIRSLRKMADEIRINEMKKTFSKLNNSLSDSDRTAIDSLTSAIVNKILHYPTINLKKQIESRDGHWYLKVVRHLFNMD